MDDPEQSADPAEPRWRPGRDRVDAEILDPDRLLPDPALRWVRDHSAAAARELARRFAIAGEARVLLVDDARMARVHEERSGIAGTTDVLTFDLAPDDGTLLDADVYVCVDEATRQAHEFGHPVEREVLLYTLHAMLHGIGHDDTDDTSYAEMHRVEDEVLTAIGVGATFDPPRDPANSPGVAR